MNMKPVKNKPALVPAVIAAVIAGVVGVAAAVWEAVTALRVLAWMAPMSDVYGYVGVKAMFFQLTAPVAMAVLAFMSSRLAGGIMTDSAMETADRRGLNSASLVAGLMACLLTRAGASAFSNTVSQLVTDPDSMLPVLCRTVCILISLMCYAMPVMLVECYFRVDDVQSGQAPCRWGAVSRTMPACFAAGQILIWLLYTVCSVISLGGNGADGMNPIIACRWGQSFALTVLLVIFVRCWQRLAAKCETQAADEGTMDESDNSD